MKTDFVYMKDVYGTDCAIPIDRILETANDLTNKHALLTNPIMGKKKERGKGCH